MTLVKEYTAPVEVLAAGGMSAAAINAQVLQNILFLMDKPYEQVIHTNGSNWTTTSTSLVVIDSSRYQCEVDTETGNIEVEVSINFNIDSTRVAYGGILIDSDYHLGGSPSDGLDKILWSQYAAANNVYAWNGKYNIYGLSAGVHTFEPVVYISGGTLTVLQTNPYTNIFGAREL